MSLVADYGSSSESENEPDDVVTVPAAAAAAAPAKRPAAAAVVAGSSKSAPARRKIFVVPSKPDNLQSTGGPAASNPETTPDRSTSIFGKPSIASFLPAPKNRKATSKASAATNGSSTASVGSTASAAVVVMQHEVSKQTRTLGGGIKNKFFDGEVAMVAPMPVPGPTSKDESSGTSASDEPPAKKVKVIPAAVLARQAKAAKLAKQGKPIPANLVSSPGPSVSRGPGPEVSAIAMPEVQDELVDQPAKPKKLNLPSLFSLDAAQHKVKPGPALPIDEDLESGSAHEYKPIMLEDDEQDQEPPTENPIDSIQTPLPLTTAERAQAELLAEINKHEPSRTRKHPASSVTGNSNNNPAIIDFSMDDFYQTNAELRAQGLLDESKRPVKAIGGGRHQLTTLLRSAQTNKEGLEEMYAQNRRTKKEAGSKYGF